jgi:hypothetical protein
MLVCVVFFRVFFFNTSELNLFIPQLIQLLALTLLLINHACAAMFVQLKMRSIACRLLCIVRSVLMYYLNINEINSINYNTIRLIKFISYTSLYCQYNIELDATAIYYFR